MQYWPTLVAMDPPCQASLNDWPAKAGHFWAATGSSPGTKNFDVDDTRAPLGRDRAQQREVKAVQLGCVGADHHRHLAGRYAGERPAQRLVRERVAGLLVGIVAAPHDLVDANLVA